MVVLEIPEKLNGKTFYDEILPSIYGSIIQEDYSIDFDMHRTELANPEGLVNLLAAAAMIRRKSELKTSKKHIPVLYLPESRNLLAYMGGAGFFRWATAQGCEALEFKTFYNESYGDAHNLNHFRPQLYGLFTGTNASDNYVAYNRHVATVEKITLKIEDSLKNFVDASELSRYCWELRGSLVQILKNALEHNQEYEGTLAYYMIQKTPYDTIEFVCSDIGQGILERMKKMLRDGDAEAIKKYGHLEQKLNKRALLFCEHADNPNRLAIIQAVKYREDSEIPGLHKIKEFARKYGGLFSIHSGNYTVTYRRGGVEEKYHKGSYFSGCHLKLVVNTK